MTHPEALKSSRTRKLVPDGKLDSHMARARRQDIDSRKAIFDRQTERGIESRESRKQIKSSVY